MKNTKFITDFPELLKEWDHEQNDKLGLDPAKTPYGTTKHVFWICEKNHHFKARVDHRTIRKSSCPYCAGKKPIVGENDFATLYPNLLTEWDYDANEKFSPSDFLPKSNKSVGWKCSKCDFKWNTSIANRTMGGTECPKCAEIRRVNSRNKTIISKNGSLFDKNPDLLKEWDFSKNKVSPSGITEKSSKKIHWICLTCGFGYAMSAADKALGSGCPVCSNKIVVPGVNDLQTKNPTLAKEWHPTKNRELFPTQITPGSSKKVWWKCNKGHEWAASVYSRTSGRGCPVCSNKIVVSGVNDLQTKNPTLAKEWHPTKNGDISPSQVSCGSNKKIWWLCSVCNNEWRAVISSRANGCGCPVCSSENRSITRAKNILNQRKSLYETHPELSRQWHPTKNGELFPTQITSGSSKKVWWKCNKGHEWAASVYSRTSGRGCPYCNYELNTSFPEQTIFYYLSKVTKAENRKVMHGKEIDIFLPDFNIGIEYNGRFYHKDRFEKDQEKAKFFRERGIRIISVIECDKDGEDGDLIFCSHPKNRLQSLKNAINLITNKLFLPKVEIDIARDEKEIKSQYMNLTKGYSVAAKFPELIKDWDYIKNDIDPDVLPSNQYIKVYWKCSKCGYLSFTAASNYAQFGCACCKGRVFIDGVNNLPITHPQLMDYWDFEKNNINPNTMTQNSQNMVWWKCKNGHSWRARIRDFIKNQCCKNCINGELL